MRKNFWCYFYAMLLIFTASCNIDDEALSVPGVTTLPAEFPEEGGVVLNAKLSGPKSIIDHGFNLYADSGRVQIKRISLGKPVKSGEFKSELPTGLVQDRTYFYNSYALAKEGNLVGELLRFNAQKNRPIEFASVSPLKAHIKDTIKIKGKYFGERYQNTLFFNDSRADIISYNDSIIICTVPVTLQEKSIELSLRGNNEVFVSDEKIELYQPEITSFGPEEVGFRDIVEIQGDHFDIEEERNNVFLGNAEAMVVYSSRNLLKVVVPDNMDSSVVKIEVRAQAQTTFSENNLSIKSPEIDEIPLKGSTRSVVVIKGSNFHPIYQRNKVYFGIAEGEVVDGTTTELRVKVPYGPFPDREAPITVRILDMEEVSNDKFTVEDAWLMITNTLPFSYYGSPGTFTIDNKAYVIAPPIEWYETDHFLWVYDPMTKDWEKHRLPFELSGTEVCGGNGSKGYVYISKDKDNFWEYDPITDQWTKKADFIGSPRNGAALFAIDRKIYVGTGSDYNTDYIDFYQFDPASNRWGRISDIDFDVYGGQRRTEISSFVINNEAYLIGGASNTGDTDYWKYNPITDTWKKMGDFLHPMHYTASFTLNGKGYLTNGSSVGGSPGKNCWEYNPNNNYWRKTNDIGHFGRYRGFAFVVNGTAYAGGGSGYDGSTSEMFQLDHNRMY